MRRTAIALIVPTIALTACGGSDDSSSDGDKSSDTEAVSDSGGEGGGDATPSAGDASTFVGELEDGTTLTVRLDVGEDDPAVAPFIDYRAQAGATDPVVWVVGSLEAPADYDDATGPPTGRFLTFVPEGGNVIDSEETATFACSELDEWFGAPTGDEAVALNEAFVEMVETTCGGQTLQVVGAPGTTTDYVMIVSGDALPEFGSIYAGLLTELTPAG